MHHVGTPHIVRATFSQAQQASGVIDLAVHQNDGADTGITQSTSRLHGGKTLHLRTDVGRGVAQHPVDAVIGDGNRRLGTCLGVQRAIAKTRAVDAVTVPLGETTASGGT